jgi:hypothetical protein
LLDDNFNLFEYLKIIVELKRFYPIEKIIPPQLFEELFQRISHDFFYIIRDNPKEAYEYFNLMKELMNYLPLKEFMFHQDSSIFEETIHRLSKDIEIEFRGNPLIILIYMELVLMSGERYRFKEDGHILERLVVSLRKRDYGIRILQRATLLLMRYKGDRKLIESLLENQPKVRNIYLTSPELARDIIEAMSELSSDERYN